MVTVLHLEGLFAKRGQVDGHTPEAFRTAVAEPVTDRRFQRDHLGEPLVGPEGQAHVYAFVAVDLQDFLNMTDIYGCAGGYIAGGGYRSKPFGGTNNRQAVQRRESKGVGGGITFCVGNSVLVTLCW